MLQFEELKLRLEALRPDIDDYADALGLAQIKSQIQQLENRATEPGFWDDLENSQKVLKQTSDLKAKVEKYEKLDTMYFDALTLIELADEAEDESLYDEALGEVDNVDSLLATARLETLLTGEYDKNNAILTFHAGSGGTEAQDWAQMLYRMYSRWAAAHGFNVKEVDYLDGDEAGLKSAVLLIEGENAYGYLKSEAGVHRLVRVSPFDSAGRRHTSFSSLEVMPEIEDDKSIEIKEDDIKMEVYRASGAGGQKVNKTSSAVRLIHIPTGITVCSQIERSQYQNREVCMNMLRSKLVEIKEREHLEKIEDMPITPLVTLQNAYVSQKLSKFSFDFYGCPVFTKAKLKNYEQYLKKD